jgi:phosphoribosylaminoimidazole-succinocarboxamide synthase
VGAEHAESRGLVLVDTKYEFGRHQGEIIAIDEVHTPDCSRYWYADDLDARIKAKEAPRMLDKEFLRSWLLQRGFKGDGPAPDIPNDVRAELARRYLELYEVLVGAPLEVHPGPALARVEANLKKALSV